MLIDKLEFELFYDTGKNKLTLIDYKPPNRGEDEPYKISFSNVKDVEGIKTCIGAWIELKEDNEKNNCISING